MVFPVALVWFFFFGSPEQTGINKTYAEANLFFCGIESMHGEIAVAGQKGDSKVVFLFIDSQTLVAQKPVHQFLGDGVIHKIIQTYDGGFLLIGSTKGNLLEIDKKAPMLKGKQDAWLCKLNAKGKLMQHYVFGDKSEAAFYDAIQLKDGSILAIGEQDGNTYALHIQGKKVERLFTKEVMSGTYRSICRGKNDELAITGYREKGSGFWFRFAESNKSTIGKIDLDFAKGQSIVYDHRNNRYGIAGEKELCFPAARSTFREKSDVLRSKLFELNVEKLLPAPDGTFFLLGSYRVQFDYDAIWMRVDAKGALHKGHLPELPGPESKGKFTDRFLDGMVLHDGRLVALGFSNNEAWLYRTQGSYTAAAPPVNKMLSFKDVQLIDNDHNDTLNANEQAYLRFSLHNDSLKNYDNLRLEVDGLEQYFGLADWGNLYQGQLPQQSNRVFSLPLPASKYLNSCDGVLTLNMITADGQLLATTQVRLISKARPLPDLMITANSRMVASKTSPSRGDVIELRLEVKNRGKGRADSVGIRFFHPFNVCSLDGNQRIVEKNIDFTYERIIDKDTLGAGQSRVYRYLFSALPHFEFDSIPIQAFVFIPGVGIEADTTIGIKIESFYSIKLPNGTKFVPEWIKNKPKRRGPSPDMDGPLPMQIDPLKIERESPKGKETDYNGEYFPVKLTVTSSVKLDTSSSFLFQLNGQTLTPKQIKPQQGRLIYIQEIKTDDVWQYGVFVRVMLPPGISKIALKVNDGKDTATESFYINRIPYKKNLFNISIGIGYDSAKTFRPLTFARNDALAFAEVLKEQKGVFFQNYLPFVVTQSDRTNHTSLISLVDIQLDPLKIGIAYTSADPDDSNTDKNDISMVFLAAHGKAEQDILYGSFSSLFVYADDYENNVNQKSKVINFNDSFIKKISGLPFFQLYFIDVCHSGGIYKDAVQASDSIPLSQIPMKNLQDRILIMTSSRSNETSLELNTLGSGHGIFTYALLEAFNNKQLASEDGYLTLQQLFQYLKKRVPEIAYFKANKHQQHPVLYYAPNFPLDMPIAKIN